jgi:hypothetical protein
MINVTFIAGIPVIAEILLEERASDGWFGIASSTTCFSSKL